ncbi:MAG: hypothetical protein JKY99_01640 [Rhizobiales bacterium]|nr:hypothetical protein [Hyphomicrobiales bacterium]
MEDIQIEAAKYKRSSAVGVESQKVFDTCMTAVADDHSKVAENEEYTEFLIYKTFHTPVTKAFGQQLNRSKSNWRIEFSKALAASATELFDVDIDQPTKHAYGRESRKSGAELRLDDVFNDENVLVAIEEFKSALRKAADSRVTIKRMCNSIDRHLAEALNVHQPNVLLINEIQLTFFLQFI